MIASCIRRSLVGVSLALFLTVGNGCGESSGPAPEMPAASTTPGGSGAPVAKAKGPMAGSAGEPDPSQAGVK